MLNQHLLSNAKSVSISKTSLEPLGYKTIFVWQESCSKPTKRCWSWNMSYIVTQRAEPVQLDFYLRASTITNCRHFHDVLTRLRWYVHWAVCLCSLTSAITADCLTSNCSSVLYQHPAWLLQIRNVTHSLFISVWYPSQSSLYNYISCFNR